MTTKTLDDLVVLMPRPKCENVHETWGPHPGCAEFMSAPDFGACTNDAGFRVSWAEADECVIPELAIDCVLVTINHKLVCLACLKDFVDGFGRDRHVVFVFVASVGEAMSIHERPGTYAYTPDHAKRLALAPGQSNADKYAQHRHHADG